MRALISCEDLARRLPNVRLSSFDLSVVGPDAHSVDSLKLRFVLQDSKANVAQTVRATKHLIND